MIHLVEIETKLRKDGVIQIPDKELEATGLHEGDIYLSERADKEGQCWPAVPTIVRLNCRRLP